jgi:hypothetical protein
MVGKQDVVGADVSVQQCVAGYVAGPGVLQRGQLVQVCA